MKTKYRFDQGLVLEGYLLKLSDLSIFVCSSTFFDLQLLAVEPVGYVTIGLILSQMTRLDILSARSFSAFFLHAPVETYLNVRSASASVEICLKDRPLPIHLAEFSGQTCH